MNNNPNFKVCECGAVFWGAKHEPCLKNVAPLIGARNSDPVTSHDAVPDEARAGSIQAAIIDALAESGPMTEEECAIFTGIERTSLSPHFKPMIRLGRVVNLINTDGTQMKRRNPTSGKMALVRGLPEHQNGLFRRPEIIVTVQQLMNEIEEL